MKPTDAINVETNEELVQSYGKFADAFDPAILPLILQALQGMRNGKGTGLTTGNNVAQMRASDLPTDAREFANALAAKVTAYESYGKPKTCSEGSFTVTDDCLVTVSVCVNIKTKAVEGAAGTAAANTASVTRFKGVTK